MINNFRSAEEALPFVPVIIIGAGRSGTNALRDAIVKIPGFGTWPCDEIDAIWSYGNETQIDDHFDVSLVRPKIATYIRKAFTRRWNSAGRPSYVVEKTCANSLRVRFVDSVLPEAKFVFIVRNGADVVASARKRWRGELEMPGLPYLLAKARFVPLVSLPRRVVSWFARRWLVGAKGRDGRLGWWGPRIRNHHTLDAVPLDEICARQWAECVQTSLRDISQLPQDRVYRLRYEALVKNPVDELSQLVRFLGAQVSESDISLAARSIRPSGNRNENGEHVDPHIEDILRPMLKQLGYRS